MYPDYKSLPSFGGKNYNSAISLIYEAFAVQFWLDQNITKDKKFSIYQAAAICGNTRQESVYNPTIQGDPHIPGFSNGIQQWNKQRNQDMMHYCVNIITMIKGTSNSINDGALALGDASVQYACLTEQEKFWGQLHFCLHEITGPSYKKAINILINNEMDPDLAGKFGHAYEGFGDTSDGKRDANATAILASYKAGLYSDKKVTVQPVKASAKSRKSNSRRLQQLEVQEGSNEMTKKKMGAAQKLILPTLKWAASPNFSQRSSRVTLIVVHDCEGSYDSSVSWFMNPASQVSAHYVVKEDGSEATQMVDLDKKAWHVCNFNSASIGIEMGGTVAKGFAQAQIQAVANMVAYLLKKYDLPATFSKGGVGLGYTSHHSLGKGGGGHSDPTSNDDEFHTKWGTLIETAYNTMNIPVDWSVNKSNTTPVVDHSVKWAQITLNKLGKYGTLDVDGDLGDKTKAAISAFEKDHKLKVTGALGFETIDALAAAVTNSPKFKSRRG